MVSKEDKVQLPILIKRVARLIDQYTENVLKGNTIARSQYRVLYYVNLLASPTQKDLLQKLNVKGSTLTIIVDSLVNKGYLVREYDELDKRIRRLKMTEEGRKLFNSIPDPINSMTEEIRKTFSDKEMAALDRDMRKIIKKLK